MKSFTTLAFAASIALTSAQVTYDPTTGKYVCAKPNAAYCAGDSGVTNIIIRCDANGIGQPGNCNDNLDGEFPYGVNYSPCYQTSPTSGEAACSKNCIVYGGSGTINGTFSLPGCVPATTQSTSTSTKRSTIASTIITTTITVPCNTTSIPLSTNIPPPLTTTVSKPSGTGPPPHSNSTTSAGGNGGGPTPISNSTTSAGGNGGNGGNGGKGSSATATPVGPTTTSPASFTGAAIANKAGAVLAAAGFLAAALL